jgi:hypothetical protein
LLLQTILRSFGVQRPFHREDVSLPEVLWGVVGRSAHDGCSRFVGNVPAQFGMVLSVLLIVADVNMRGAMTMRAIRLIQQIVEA